MVLEAQKSAVTVLAGPRLLRGRIQALGEDSSWWSRACLGCGSITPLSASLPSRAFISVSMNHSLSILRTLSLGSGPT